MDWHGSLHSCSGGPEDFFKAPAFVLAQRPALDDRDGVFFSRFGIDADGAVLVRPDGYVAWRTPRATDASADDLSHALRQILDRDE